MMQIKAPDSPYYAYVELQIGNHNISKLPPNHIESFNYERVTKDSSNKLIMTLHDESALLIESMIMDSIVDGSIPCTWRYGYTNGVSSPTYSGMITEYDLDFTSIGVSLNIEGISNGLNGFGSPITKTYENMDIHEIVKEIANEQGWGIEYIETCETIYDDVDSDGNQTKKKYVCSNLPAVKFIEQELKPYARKLGTGESDFRVYFDDSVNPPNLVFAPPSYVGKSTNTYFYEFVWGNGDRNSPVISFNPNFSGVVTAFNGASTVDASGVDKLKNQMFRVRHSDSNGIESDHTQIIGGSSYSLDEAKSIAAKMFYTQANQSYPADLTIVGDPNVNPMSMVSILVLNKEGLAHHSSGAYIVTQVVDDISGGEFTTTLSLIKNPLEIKDVIKVVDGTYIPSKTKTP